MTTTTLENMTKATNMAKIFIQNATSLEELKDFSLRQQEDILELAKIIDTEEDFMKRQNELIDKAIKS